MWKLSLIVIVVSTLLLSGMTQAARLDITAPGDTIQGVPDDGDWPGNEAPPLAIDDDTATKYLHFKGDFDPDPGTGGAGFQVTPSLSQTVVVGLTLTTANDAAERDPTAFELSGSNVSIDGPYTLIASGDIVDFSQGAAWPRFTMNETPIEFDNDVAYDHYQIIFTDIRDRGAANSMQVAEVELLGMSLTAYNPNPANGALLTEFSSGILGYSLSWIPGGSAASHDVYFGTDYAEVEAGTGETFRGNQTSTYFYAGYGFTPNDPAPTGFLPGTTYYWRIDEVEADGFTKYPSPVWSFSLPATKAYTPSPADGTKFVDPDVDLSWVPGFGAVVQTVYFGDDYDTVSTATSGGAGVGNPTYDPGPLELETTYYWRVDTVGTFGQATGDVWSFRTLPDIPLTSDPNLIGWWKLDEDSGTTALDWSGRGHHGTLVGDPEWVDGYDGGALQCDGSGDWATTQLMPADYGLDGANPKTVTAWVYTTGFNDGGIYDMGSQTDGQEFCLRTTTTANQWRVQRWGYPTYDFDVTYPTQNVWVHFAQVYTGSAGGNLTTLYANGVQIGTQTVELNTANASFVIGRYGSGTSFNGIIDDLRIYNKALTLEEVKQTMRGDTRLAWDPSPVNGSTPDIDQAVPLSWSPGDNASEHDVYFGTDEDAVEFADISDTTGIYRIRQSGTNYTPGEGAEWGGGPFYWRIDEYNTDGSISKGRVWSFTVADFISIDNIEGYNAEDQIWWHWVDGLGFVKPDNTSHPGNGSGSEVGDGTTPSFTEETIVHGGDQSMPFKYNNNDPFKLKYSEAKLTLSAARDWTKHGVKALSLWFQGYPASAGSFTDNFDDTYSMTVSGADITGQSDEFHFAYKMLTGAGTITARVDSVGNTNDWAKAGVMIRETLDPNSAHAFACITPAQGVAAQGRLSTGADSVNVNQGAGDITAPHWVKLERDLSGNFTVTRSTNGSTWEPVEGAIVQNIPMNTNVYVGLALSGNNVNATCEAAFSNVTITGNVTGQWASQDIGIMSNDAEPLYVAIANNTGQPAVVVHDNPNAAQIDEWTEWNIDLRDFAGINLADVNSIAVGLGNRNNPQAGGLGKMYFDDFALYRPRYVPSKLPPVAVDLNRNGIVDMADIEVIAGDWLGQGGGNGLWYEYCEGQWDVLPDFDLQMVAGQGVVNNFDISVRNQDDNFGFRFSGQINIATAGDYTFYTTSDDGSQLFINGTLLVDNDGLHGAAEQSGTVSLTASLHDIVATMFELGGDESLVVEYEGPGVARQEIPDDVLSRPAPVADLNQDGVVNFKDHAVLADEWLDEQLWPEE